MSLQPESVLVCEGYHDRAFLRSWLRYLGCEDFAGAGYQGGAKQISGKGQYAFRSANKSWLRIVPTGGDSRLYGPNDTPNTLVSRRNTSPISAIILFTDDDTDAGPASASGSGGVIAEDEPTASVSQEGVVKRRTQFEGWARACGAVPAADPGDFELRGGMCSTRLSLVVWQTPEPSSPLLPAQQSLERLVCAAMAEVYPERCQSIRDWLATRPGPPPGEKVHKTHAAAHMAGWFSDRGYEGLFDAVWQDERIRMALRARMTSIGAERIAQLVLG